MGLFVVGKLFYKAGEGSGGGSDPHNLGYYADLTALQTAHPTGTDGDYAVLGSTDTIWVWDSDTLAWVDTDQKGQVTSVNNQTGAVTLTASDVGALPDNTHIPADPVQADWDEADSNALDYIKNKPTIPAAQVNSDWNSTSGVSEILNKPTLATVATTGAYSDLSGTPTIPDPTQVSTMPTAGVDELGKVYQFIGTTDANYTHGYFYECVSDGGNPATYSWTRTDVQPGSSLPSQTGNAGKFLTTDGTDASWDTSVKQLQIKSSSTLYCDFVVVSPTGGGTGIFFNSGSGSNVQLGGNFVGGLSYVSKLYVRSLYYGSHNSQEITVPSVGGTLALQIATIPTAGSTYEGTIYQFTGTTDSTYTNGHFYKCVSDGGNPATYSWEEVQLGGGGGSTGTTASLVVADWSSNTQTVNVTGVTASNNVIVAPAPASQADYTAAGIICTAQGAGTLTFTCTTVPSSAITVNVLII